jgi:hypothetical protein
MLPRAVVFHLRSSGTVGETSSRSNLRCTQDCLFWADTCDRQSLLRRPSAWPSSGCNCSEEASNCPQGQRFHDRFVAGTALGKFRDQADPVVVTATFDFRIGGHCLPSGLKRGNVAGWAGRPAHAKTYHSSGVDPKRSIY